LCVPIRNNTGEVIGCTQMINKIGALEFNDIGIALMSAFNVFCGIVLSNAQLYGSATQSKKVISTLFELVQKLAQSGDFEGMISMLNEGAKSPLQCDFCWIFAIDQVNKVARPIGSAHQMAFEISLQRDIVDFIATTGADLNVNDPKSDDRFDLTLCDRMKITARSIMGMLIRDSKHQIVGVIIAINKDGVPRFSDDDCSIFRAFSLFAGFTFDRNPTAKDFNPLTYIPVNELMKSEVPENLQVPASLMFRVTSHAFSARSFSKLDQMRVIIHFFTQPGLLSEFAINVQTDVHYIEAVSAEYS
jgi:GAF domain-containing protein